MTNMNSLPNCRGNLRARAISLAALCLVQTTVLAQGVVPPGHPDHVKQRMDQLSANEPSQSADTQAEIVDLAQSLRAYIQETQLRSQDYNASAMRAEADRMRVASVAPTYCDPLMLCNSACNTGRLGLDTSTDNIYKTCTDKTEAQLGGKCGTFGTITGKCAQYVDALAYCHKQWQNNRARAGLRWVNCNTCCINTIGGVAGSPHVPSFSHCDDVFDNVELDSSLPAGVE